MAISMLEVVLFRAVKKEDISFLTRLFFSSPTCTGFVRFRVVRLVFCVQALIWNRYLPMYKGNFCGLLFIALAISWSFISSAKEEAIGRRDFSTKICAKFSKWPNSIIKSQQTKLGELCTIKENLQGRWMYNEEGQWDCGQCCTDHFWNGEVKECQPCGSDYELEQGVSDRCREKEYPFDYEHEGTVQIGDCSPGSVKVGNVTSNIADVAWDSFCKDCDDVERIEIALHNEAGTINIKNLTVGPSETSYQLTNLTSGVNYCLEIRAANSFESGPWSEPIRFETKMDPSEKVMDGVSTSTPEPKDHVDEQRPTQVTYDVYTDVEHASRAFYWWSLALTAIAILLLTGFYVKCRVYVNEDLILR